jgi:hypothetical protein
MTGKHVSTFKLIAKIVSIPLSPIVENMGRRFVVRPETNLHPIIISAEAANIMFTMLWGVGGVCDA